MEVLENLRFGSIPRFLVKMYHAGTKRHIAGRLHNGFIFCLEGKIAYTTSAGKKMICDRNHCIMAPKGIDYDLLVLEETVSQVLDFELLDGFFDEMYCFKINETKTFSNNFVKMEKKYLLNSNSYELMGLSSLYDITARINGYGIVNEKYQGIINSEIYLEENFCDEKITIEKLAKQSNISEVYFRRIFKEKYGVSPYQYINDMRINKAKDMLLNEDANISQISLDCGYTNIYSFSRAFKNTVGMSPSQFKNVYAVSE